MKTINVPGKTTAIGVRMTPIKSDHPSAAQCTYTATCEVSGFNNPVWDYTAGANMATLNMEPYPSYGVANIVINFGNCTFTVNINLEGG